MSFTSSHSRPSTQYLDRCLEISRKNKRKRTQTQTQTEAQAHLTESLSGSLDETTAPGLDGRIPRARPIGVDTSQNVRDGVD